MKQSTQTHKVSTNEAANTLRISLQCTHHVQNILPTFQIPIGSWLLKVF